MSIGFDHNEANLKSYLLGYQAKAVFCCVDSTLLY